MRPLLSLIALAVLLAGCGYKTPLSLPKPKPVAHNAGELWRRRAFIKQAGLVTVSIGAPIDSRQLTPDELMRRVEDWIEGEVRRLGTQTSER